MIEKIMDSNKSGATIIQILLEKGIVTFNTELPYVFTTGLKSPIYIDNRMIISFPKEREIVIDELVKLIKNKINIEDIDYISSSLSFAAPFGVLVANVLKLPLILIKEQETSFGKRNKIEGKLPPGKNVLIVEDHISTGAAVVDNVEAVRRAGGNVKLCVAVTDYEIDIAQKALESINITSFSLATGAEIVEEANTLGKISQEEKRNINDWLNNPVKWGQNRGFYSED